jgi:hypothetical protein
VGSNPASPAFSTAWCSRGRLATAFPMLNNAAGGPARWLHHPLSLRRGAPAGDWPRVSLGSSPMVAVQPVGCIARSQRSTAPPVGDWPRVSLCSPTLRAVQPVGCITRSQRSTAPPVGDWPRVSLCSPTLRAVQPVGCITRSERSMVLPRATGHGFPFAAQRCVRSNPLAASPSPIEG